MLSSNFSLQVRQYFIGELVYNEELRCQKPDRQGGLPWEQAPP